MRDLWTSDRPIYRVSPPRAGPSARVGRYSRSPMGSPLRPRGNFPPWCGDLTTPPAICAITGARRARDALNPGQSHDCFAGRQEASRQRAGSSALSGLHALDRLLGVSTRDLGSTNLAHLQAEAGRANFNAWLTFPDPSSAVIHSRVRRFILGLLLVLSLCGCLVENSDLAGCTGS